MNDAGGFDAQCHARDKINIRQPLTACEQEGGPKKGETQRGGRDNPAARTRAEMANESSPPPATPPPEAARQQIGET